MSYIHVNAEIDLDDVFNEIDDSDLKKEYEYRFGESNSTIDIDENLLTLLENLKKKHMIRYEDLKQELIDRFKNY